MKKILSVFIISSSILVLSAQQNPVLKNKRGILILPQRGDFCFGISAEPFLDYLGNMFNNSTNNTSPIIDFAGANNSFFAKYMKESNLAYRANFRIGIRNSSENYNVLDASPGAAVNGTVVDVRKNRVKGLGLGFGIEKRKGKTRIQGFYGAEVFLNLNSSKTDYTYGNSLENLDTNTRRVKKMASSSVFSIGLRGFAGVEYFVAPNFSIGGELGYGPSFNSVSSAEQTIEQYDFSSNTSIEERVQLSPKTTGFTLDTDSYNAVLKILFYF
jgi:hypothetical protein